MLIHFKRLKVFLINTLHAVTFHQILSLTPNLFDRMALCLFAVYRLHSPLRRKHQNSL